MLKKILIKHKIKTISKELDIKVSTLYRWINNEKINNHVKFIELLIYLNVDIQKFLECYKNNKEYED